MQMANAGTCDLAKLECSPGAHIVMSRVCRLEIEAVPGRVADDGAICTACVWESKRTWRRVLAADAIAVGSLLIVESCRAPIHGLRRTPTTEIACHKNARGSIDGTAIR